MTSALSPAEISKAYPKFFDLWLPADGRSAPPRSAYSRLKGGLDVRVPDLRSVFLRGLNQFDGGHEPVGEDRADPDTRAALSYQSDALQTHRHNSEHHGAPGIYDSSAGTGPSARSSAASYKNRPVFLILEPSNVPGRRHVNVSPETRPKNVAVYFYVRID
jgi:hypothetical protein